MRLVILASVICGLALAQEFSQDTWRVYYPEAFDEDELCRVLNCQTYQVCMVKGSNAFCVNGDQLHEIHGLKVDAKSGLTIEKEKENNLEEKMENYAKKVNEVETALEEDVNEVTHFIRKQFQTHQTNEHHHKERHSGEQENAECSVDKIKEMGLRLLKWFNDVHQVMTGDIAPLPRHRIQCAADVSWMFQQWDGDKDGELNIDELNSLEGDRYEPCIKPFIDRCDDNADNAVSLDEWCDCFLWVGQERVEPPCHKAKHAVDPHLLGSFVPRCDVDGYYRVEQCHENQCWCTDKWGREFDRSRTYGKRPDCGQYAEKDDVEVNADTIVFGEL